MSFLFDPEMNLFLQSFRTPWLTTFMLMVSALGSSLFLSVSAAFVLFCLDLRKGILMLQILLWSILLTDFLKSVLTLPRPTDVHLHVTLLENEYPQWLMELFPLRMNYGFPSGHVCSITVFWGTLLSFFPDRFHRFTGALLIFFMSLSRMYLGRHFLGDVLGGFVLGLMILLAGKTFLLKAFGSFVESQNNSSPSRGISSHLFCLYLFVLPLLFLFAPFFEAGDIGKLLGVHLVFLFLLIRGFPEESQDHRAGITRLALAMFFYISIKLLLLNSWVSTPNKLWFDALAEAVATLVTIWATIEISQRTGLYVRRRC